MLQLNIVDKLTGTEFFAPVIFCNIDKNLVTDGKFTCSAACS
jgi:hypothetical protein